MPFSIVASLHNDAAGKADGAAGKADSDSVLPAIDSRSETRKGGHGPAIRDTTLATERRETWDLTEDQNRPMAQTDAVPMPRHRRLMLDGIHAYPTPQSLHAGTVLTLRVSSTVPYNLSVYRVGDDLYNSSLDVSIATLGSFAAHEQPIYPGSYVAATGLAGSLRTLTIQMWLQLFKSRLPQRRGQPTGLVTQCDIGGCCMFALQLDSAARLVLSLGSNTFVSHRRIDAGLKWRHVLAMWNGSAVEMWIDGEQWYTAPSATAELAPCLTDLRIGAMGNEERAADYFLDGTVGHTSIHTVPLTSSVCIRT